MKYIKRGYMLQKYKEKQEKDKNVVWNNGYSAGEEKQIQ